MPSAKHNPVVAASSLTAERVCRELEVHPHDQHVPRLGADLAPSGWFAGD